MHDTDYNRAAEQSARILASARWVAMLTGAGVSAESGVPTFRDAQTGLWARFDPLQLATPTAFANQPKLVWDWYAWRRELVLKVEPNPAHGALADIERRVPDCLLITQNVDGLHRRAGSRKVVELHGNIGRVKCSREGTVVDRWDCAADEVPRCAACGALLRPDVVWFEEMLPPEALAAARSDGAPLRSDARRRNVRRGLPGGRATTHRQSFRRCRHRDQSQRHRAFANRRLPYCAGQQAASCRHWSDRPGLPPRRGRSCRAIARVRLGLERRGSIQLTRKLPRHPRQHHDAEDQHRPQRGAPIFPRRFRLLDATERRRDTGMSTRRSRRAAVLRRIVYPGTSVVTGNALDAAETLP